MTSCRITGNRAVVENRVSVVMGEDTGSVSDSHIIDNHAVIETDGGTADIDATGVIEIIGVSLNQTPNKSTCAADIDTDTSRMTPLGAGVVDKFAVFKQ